MELKRLKTQGWHICDTIYREGINTKPSDPFILLLHGFNERAQRIFRKTLEAIPENLTLVVPNAPFPMPRRVHDQAGDYYKIGYAWYFYDDLKDEFLIDYSYPSAWLNSLIKTMGLDQRPMIIIGYSQGGYLAPFVGEACSNTKKVIGINCRFRDDMLSSNPPSYPLFALHGDNDDKVCPVRAQASFEKLKAQGYQGDFKLMAGKGHELDQDVCEELKQLILSK